MVEHRKYRRLSTDCQEHTATVYAGGKENVKLLDVSARGLRARFSRRVELGTDFYGKLNIHPQVSPFFVKGKVVRVTEKGNAWETAVNFDKVSTLPFHKMYMYLMI